MGAVSVLEDEILKMDGEDDCTILSLNHTMTKFVLCIVYHNKTISILKLASLFGRCGECKGRRLLEL